MCSFCNIQKRAFDRHRERLFGDASLEAYTVNPEDGEQLAGTFADGWFAQRIRPITSEAQQRDSGAWQFQIWAADDWETSQAFMLRLATLVVDGRRWKTGKIERPVGRSQVWKVNAQIQ